MSEKITSVAPRGSWLGEGDRDRHGHHRQDGESEAVTTWATARTKENTGQCDLRRHDPMKLGTQHQVPDLTPTLHRVGPMKTLPPQPLEDGVEEGDSELVTLHSLASQLCSLTDCNPQMPLTAFSIESGQWVAPGGG